MPGISVSERWPARSGLRTAWTHWSSRTTRSGSAWRAWFGMLPRPSREDATCPAQRHERVHCSRRSRGPRGGRNGRRLGRSSLLADVVRPFVEVRFRKSAPATARNPRAQRQQPPLPRPAAMPCTSVSSVGPLTQQRQFVSRTPSQSPAKPPITPKRSDIPPSELPPHASGTTLPTIEPSPTQSQITRLSMERTSTVSV